MANEKRLIDANAYLDELKDYHDSIMQDPDVGEQMKWCESVCFGNAVNVLVKMPTLDPVHAAGGCYCWECKFWVQDDDVGHCENPDGLDNYARPEDFCPYGIKEKQ